MILLGENEKTKPNELHVVGNNSWQWKKIRPYSRPPVGLSTILSEIIAAGNKTNQFSQVLSTINFKKTCVSFVFLSGSGQKGNEKEDKIRTKVVESVEEIRANNLHSKNIWALALDRYCKVYSKRSAVCKFVFSKLLFARKCLKDIQGKTINCSWEFKVKKDLIILFILRWNSLKYLKSL